MPEAVQTNEAGKKPTDDAGNGAGPPLFGTTMSFQGICDVPPALAGHPRYEILQLLGQGGMGAVYLARHKVMNRLVALKIIRAQFVDGTHAVERFHREVEAAARLHHPNIVTAHDADVASDTHFLVMEYVEGADLGKHVRAEGPLSQAKACDYVRQAALGLQHAHEHGMVHRDIKPHNLMLTAEGVVKVMDFGLALLGGDERIPAGLTGENVLMGTADYIAPEQAQNAHGADIRADIYSLGCTLFHLLAGRPPFQGGSMVEKISAHLATPPPLLDLPPAAPPGLRAVLARMMEKDPARRYQTPAEVGRALAPFLEVQGSPVGRKISLRKAVLALMGLLIAGGAFLAWGLTGNRNHSARPLQTDFGPLPPTFTNDLGMEFVLVPKGKFRMGGGGGKVGDQEVEILRDFYLGVHEVTQEQWETLIGNNPSAFSRKGKSRGMVVDLSQEFLKRLPVEQVSWDDVQIFLKLLNEREQGQGWLYRLPKEAEWEYACRGGPHEDDSAYGFDFYLDKPLNELRQSQANFGGAHGLRRTNKIAMYPPNTLGLYDMHGNVMEWCDDDQPSADGVAQRAHRGGCWWDEADACKASARMLHRSTSRFTILGFRVARVPSTKE